MVFYLSCAALSFISRAILLCIMFRLFFCCVAVVLYLCLALSLFVCFVLLHIVKYCYKLHLCVLCSSALYYLWICLNPLDCISSCVVPRCHMCFVSPLIPDVLSDCSRHPLCFSPGTCIYQSLRAWLPRTPFSFGHGKTSRHCAPEREALP